MTGKDASDDWADSLWEVMEDDFRRQFLARVQKVGGNSELFPDLKEKPALFSRIYPLPPGASPRNATKEMVQEYLNPYEPQIQQKKERS